VRSQLAAGHDVLNRHAVGSQEVADQPPMALPEQSLSAHDRRPLLSGNFKQLLHPFSELVGEHVVGIVAKPFVLQAEVGGFVQQQFNNLKLMRAIENAQIGRRLLLLGEVLTKPGQQIERVLDVIEGGMIEYFVACGYELINKPVAPHIGTGTSTLSMSTRTGDPHLSILPAVRDVLMEKGLSGAVFRLDDSPA
jgi:hypothetical protein